MTMADLGSMLPLAIVLGLIAGCFWFVRRSARKRQRQGIRLHGVGGWLSFFIVVSSVLAPLVQVGSTLRNFSDAERISPALPLLPGYSEYKAFCWLLVLTLCVWQIWTANRLRTRYEPASVAHVKQFLVIAPLALYFGDVGAAWFSLHVNAASEDIGTTIRGLLSSFIWYLYFAKSERVRNTYFASEERAQNVKNRPELQTSSPGRLDPVLNPEMVSEVAAASALRQPELSNLTQLSPPPSPTPLTTIVPKVSET